MYVCMYVVPDGVCVLTTKGHRVEIGAVHFLGGFLSLFGRTRLQPNYIHTYMNTSSGQKYVCMCVYCM